MNQGQGGMNRGQGGQGDLRPHSMVNAATEQASLQTAELTCTPWCWQGHALPPSHGKLRRMYPKSYPKPEKWLRPHLYSLVLTGSRQKASHVTVLSCRTSFHCWPVGPNKHSDRGCAGLMARMAMQQPGRTLNCTFQLSVGVPWQWGCAGLGCAAAPHRPPPLATAPTEPAMPCSTPTRVGVRGHRRVCPDVDGHVPRVDALLDLAHLRVGHL